LFKFFRNIQYSYIQLFEPAKTFAVTHDHDYLKLTPQDNFPERIGPLDINKERINAIEERKMGKADNPAWKSERIMRLPSTMYGRICKATERTDMTKLDKAGHIFNCYV
jgi:hypothetical protein